VAAGLGGRSTNGCAAGAGKAEASTEEAGMTGLVRGIEAGRQCGTHLSADSGVGALRQDLGLSTPRASAFQPIGLASRHAEHSGVPRHSFTRRGASHPEFSMLHYAVVFFVIALIAALFGFGGIAAGAAGIAKILFVVFIILAIATFLFGRGRGT